jgi:hypothetical protein
MVSKKYLPINDNKLVFAKNAKVGSSQGVAVNCETNIFDGINDTLYNLLISNCTLTEKYNIILDNFNCWVDTSCNTSAGIFESIYLKTRCYDLDDAPNKTIYDCLSGLRYHYSDIREVPNQDNSFSMEEHGYYFSSMADPNVETNQIYITEEAGTAWQNFLNALEADTSFTKNQIATLIGASVPYAVYKDFCTKKDYFSKYLVSLGDDPLYEAISGGVRAEMARISLINNSYLLRNALDDERIAFLYHHCKDLTAAQDKNTCLKLLLTLGTSLEGKKLVKAFTKTKDKSDTIDAINSYATDADSTLLGEVITLLDDFTWGTN